MDFWDQKLSNDYQEVGGYSILKVEVVFFLFFHTREFKNGFFPDQTLHNTQNPLPEESLHNFGALISIIPELHKIRLSRDFEALKLWKGSSGYLRVVCSVHGSNIEGFLVSEIVKYSVRYCFYFVSLALFFSSGKMKKVFEGCCWENKF